MVNMGNVWDRTTEFLSDNLGAILPVALLAIFVPQAVSGVLGGAIQPGGPNNGALLLGGFALIVPVIWGQLVLVGLALDPDAGRAAAMRSATRAFGWYLLIALLLFVVILGLLLPIPIAFAAGGLDAEAMARGDALTAFANISPGVRLFAVLVALLVALVMVFLSIRVTVLAPAVLIQESCGLGAIRRSFTLSGGMMWKMIGVYLLFFILLTVITLAAQSVFGILLSLVFPGSGPVTIVSVVTALVTGAISTVYYAIVSGFSAKLYRAAVAARVSA